MTTAVFRPDKSENRESVKERERGRNGRKRPGIASPGQGPSYPGTDANKAFQSGAKSESLPELATDVVLEAGFLVCS